MFRFHVQQWEISEAKKKISIKHQLTVVSPSINCPNVFPFFLIPLNSFQVIIQSSLEGKKCVESCSFCSSSSNRAVQDRNDHKWMLRGILFNSQSIILITLPSIPQSGDIPPFWTGIPHPISHLSLFWQHLSLHQTGTSALLGFFDDTSRATISPYLKNINTICVVIFVKWTIVCIIFFSFSLEFDKMRRRRYNLTHFHTFFTRLFLFANALFLRFSGVSPHVTPPEDSEINALIHTSFIFVFLTYLFINE